MLLASGGPALAESIYFIGNSVTDTINYAGFQALAQSRGYTQPWGRQMIPGAPLSWLWDNPTGGFTQEPYGYPINALPNYSWDNLSLQPFDRLLNDDVASVKNFLSLLFGSGGTPTASQLTNRARTQIYLFSRWPRQDDPARPGGPRPFNVLWLRAYTGGFDGTMETKDYFEKLTAAVRAESVGGVSLANRTFLVPVGGVMFALHQKMVAGQLPGYSNIFQLYTDGIHLNATGSYLVACTYFAVLYGESPVGLPVPANFGAVDASLVPAIQQTVWEVVQAEPLAGVTSGTGLLLTTAAVPPAYAGRPYSTTFAATGGIAPRTFSLLSGTLPTGLSLSGVGVLSGTPTVSGTFPITVRVTDSTTPTPQSDSKAFTLRVEVNSIPVITSGSILPGVKRGNRYEVPLLANGGNGQLTWTLTSGSLPPGIVLGGGGILVGSALAEGTYTFRATVADADQPPDTDARDFQITVGPPGMDTLEVQRALSPIRIDGDFAETHWALNRMVQQTKFGTPNNTSNFGALWDMDAFYVAVKVLDTQISSGSGAGANRDSIEVFLDAFNDKQAEFNSQHRQFRVAYDGSLFERGGRSTGVTHALLPIPGGYQLEMRIPWSNLGINPAGGSTVLGFDVGINDVDTGTVRQSFAVFAGADAADPRPSQFGNAILSTQTVTGTGGEPAASPASPVVYEPFDYAAGKLRDANGGSGFNGPWLVEADHTTGYLITGSDSLSYTDILAAGRRMSGGQSWATAGRALNTTGALLPWKKPSSNVVGASNTTLWISWLARPNTASAEMKFSLDNGGGAIYHDNNGIVRVRRSGGFWHLSLMNGAVASPTSVSAPVGQTALLVLKIEFGATSRVSLFVNPPATSTPPSSASATATTTSASFDFDQFQLYPGHDPGHGEFDEIRMGASWSDVVAVASRTVSPAYFSPPASIVEAPFMLALSTAQTGGTIRFTTDGSLPSRTSPVYTGPFQVTQSGTIRAVVFAANDAASPPTGAVYTFLNGYDAWASRYSWNGADASPNADANGDGIVNLLACALGMNPLAFEPSRLPTLSLTGSDVGLSYNRSANFIDYIVETTTSLADGAWTTSGVYQGSPDAAGNVRAWVLRSPGEKERYLRLRVRLR